MQNRPLYGPQVKLSSSDAQRQQLMAQQLLKEGIDLSPVRSNWEALARVGTAGIGGYLQNQAGETEKTYQSDRAKALAAALTGDPNQAAAGLMANPSTADMGAQLALNNMMFNRDRTAKKEDVADQRGYESGVRKEERGYRLEDLYITQNFQKEMQAMNQAFAAGQQDKALSHATNLAQMQQDFTKGENALNRESQATLKDKEIIAQQPTRDLANILTGQKIKEGEQKLTDDAKAKAESLVSTERMIRSIDELSAHPGFEGTVGISFGQRHIPGTDAASFDARLETLKSQAFLPMVAQLKGMGQLSDAEGKKLTAAIGALDPRMSEKEFKASMDTIRSDMNAAIERMGGKPIPKPENDKSQRPTQGTRLKYNPATGELE